MEDASESASDATNPKRSPASASFVRDMLASVLSHDKNAAIPNEADVGELTRWVNFYREQPWTPESVRAYRDADQVVRKQRAVLDRAAEILQGDQADWMQHLSSDNQAFANLAKQRVNEIESAIAALKMPRGWFEHGLPRTSPQGRDQKPWAVVARKLAQETLAALQSAQFRVGQAPQGGYGHRDGPIVRFVSAVLKTIYDSSVPSRPTILEAIEENFRADVGDQG